MRALLGASAPIAWLAWHGELRGPLEGLDPLLLAPAVAGVILGCIWPVYVFVLGCRK